MNKRTKYKYGVSPTDYKYIFDIQEGKCAICGTPHYELNKRLGVDHDHKTGKVRGLLCMKCNTILGMAKDNVDILLSSVKYLST